MSNPNPKASPYKALTIFTTLQNVLAKGIHDQNFKNGAFRTSITSPSTPSSVIAAFKIMFASPELSTTEKEIVKNCRIHFIHLRNRFSGNSVPGHAEASELMERLKELERMFEWDAASREPENAYVDFDATPTRTKKKRANEEGDGIASGKRVWKALGSVPQ